MNLSKLAQMANVSVSTVSKAFSDSHEISRQTKEMIFDVAKKYGCFDKYYKPVYTKKVIAVICPEMLGIHYTQMATFLSREISMRNGTMLLSVDEFSSEKNKFHQNGEFCCNYSAYYTTRYMGVILDFITRYSV